MSEREGKIISIDEEEGIVVVEEYNGEEVHYEIVTFIDVDDNTYLIMVPEEEDTEEGYALRVVEGENIDTRYELVIDEDELNRIEEELAKQ